MFWHQGTYLKLIKQIILIMEIFQHKIEEQIIESLNVKEKNYRIINKKIKQEKKKITLSVLFCLFIGFYDSLNSSRHGIN